MTDQSDTPWEQNACFTIKAESEEKVREISRKLDAYARRIGAGVMFSDYEGPQPDASDQSQRDPEERR